MSARGRGLGGRSVRTVAGEIMAYMKANNYEVRGAMSGVLGMCSTTNHPARRRLQTLVKR